MNTYFQRSYVVARFRCLARSLLSCVWPIRSGYDVVRILGAATLLAAAGLKAWQLATEPILAKTWLDSRWVLMAAVEFELFFGLWLLSNNLPRLTWLAAIGCFTLFASISLCKAALGYATCGCFGTVRVNPWLTSVLDVAFVASLFLWQPNQSSSPFGGRAAGEGALHTGSLSVLFPRSLVVLFVWLSFGEASR